MDTQSHRPRSARLLAARIAIAGVIAALTVFPANVVAAAGLLEPTTTHHVTPQQKAFPDDRACPEGTTLFSDQFQSLTQNVESGTATQTYNIGGVPVTVTLTIHPDNTVDFQIENGTTAQIFVKGGAQSEYLLYQYDPPVAGASNTGAVNHDTGLHGGHVSGDSYQDISHLDLCLSAVDLEPLGVVKTANAAFTRTVTWTLDKSVDDASHTGQAGGVAGSSTWTVVATKTETLGSFQVAGTVTVSNSNDFAVPFTLADQLNDGTSVNVTCGSESNAGTVPANGSIECTYSVTPTGGTATLATAVVTPTNPSLAAVTATAAVTFTTNVVGDDTVTLGDPRFSHTQQISSTTTVPFPESFPCPSEPTAYTNGVHQRTETNTATLNGPNTDLSDSAAVDITCTLEVGQQAPPVADIAVVKTAAPTIVTPGGNVTWTLRAINNGPDPADNATIVDNLPASLTLVSFTSPAGWDCSGSVAGNPGKLSCTKPTMGVNESATFTLTTTVAASAAGTSINNTAVVSTSSNETTTANNQDAEPISVQQAVLPPTGGEVWNRVAIAGALVLVGAALLAINRRRNHTVA